MINEALLVSEKPLKVKIISVEGSSAKLCFSDMQAVEVNKKYLPKFAKVGDELYVNLLSDESLKMTKGEIARLVLENIISPDERQEKS